MECGDYNCGCEPIRIASSKRCEREDPHASLRKLVDLMEDSYSSDLYDRHLMILNDFIAASTLAFWVQDLPYVMRLLEQLFERIDSICLFRNPLEQLLALCAVPPILTHTTEPFTYNRDIQEYFAFLGFLLIRTQDKMLHDLIIRALKELFQRKAPCELFQLTLEACFTALEISELPRILSQVLEIADEDLYEKLLPVVLILTEASPKVCHQMISEKTIDTLLIRLDPLWKTRDRNQVPSASEDSTVQYFEITSKILWNLFEAFKHGTKTFKKSIAFPSAAALWTLDIVFRAFTLSKTNRSNRNHIMAIFLQCLDCFPNIDLTKTYLKRDIGTLSSATEIGLGGTWAAQVKFTADNVDYEFKKMLLLALCYCCKLPGSPLLLFPKRIFPALLKIIAMDTRIAYHPQQHNKLVSLSLHTLQTLASALPNDFFYFNGPFRLLTLIDDFNANISDLAVLQDALKALHTVCYLGNESILESIVMKDGLGVLRLMSQNLFSNRPLKLNMQRCLAYIFSTLGRLCSIKKGCDYSTVHLCINCLKRLNQSYSDDPPFDPKFLICIIHFLWEGIVLNESNLKLFISLEGVYLLLDLFEKSCFPVRLIILGALVDMCYEGKCVPHLITWRKNGVKFLPLLLELFRDENVKLGVKTAADGTIADIEIPIMGEHQWYETFYQAKDPNSSPAIVDLLGSCRPKIYAIIQLLSNRHESRVDIVNEQYRLYNMEDINVEDQITLLLAENFLALKLGEAWVELNKDFENTGIRPLAVDGEVVSFLIQRHHKWSLHIKAIQEELLKRDMEINITKEKQLYTTLKESKLLDSLRALHALDFIARTTERMFRLVSKMKQTSELERTLKFTEGAEQHRTSLFTLRVNPVFNQEVNIHSNRIEDSSEKSFDMVSVSTEFSEESTEESEEEEEDDNVDDDDDETD